MCPTARHELAGIAAGQSRIHWCLGRQQQAPWADGRIPILGYLKETIDAQRRNQLQATVKSVKLGNVMAEVVMSLGNVELVAAITRGSAEQLNLKAGDSVKAIIKATEVLIDKS